MCTVFDVSDVTVAMSWNCCDVTGVTVAMSWYCCGVSGITVVMGCIVVMSVMYM